MITVDQFNQIFPKNKNAQAIVNSLNLILPKYNITTKDRIAYFIAQCGHESAGFTRFIENCNYSDYALCEMWKSKFPTIDFAKHYHRNPELIANRVYADRNGNGNEQSGDGYKFRGRGCIQLTGRANYDKFAKSINKTLDECIQYCETIDGSIESACFFWKENNLNKYCDNKDFINLTKRINGGTNGLEDRRSILTRCSVL